MVGSSGRHVFFVAAICSPSSSLPASPTFIPKSKNRDTGFGLSPSKLATLTLPLHAELVIGFHTGATTATSGGTISYDGGGGPLVVTNIPSTY